MAQSSQFYTKYKDPDFLKNLDLSKKSDLLTLKAIVGESSFLPRSITIPVIMKLGSEAKIPIDGVRSMTHGHVSGNEASDPQSVMLNSAMHSFINTAIRNIVDKEINSEISALEILVRPGRDIKEALYSSIDHGNVEKAAKMVYLLRRETAQNAVLILGEALTNITASIFSNLNDNSAAKDALATRQGDIAKILLVELEEISKMVEWKGNGR